MHSLLLIALAGFNVVIFFCHPSAGDEMGRFEGGSAFLLVFQLDPSQLNQGWDNHEDRRGGEEDEERKEQQAATSIVHQPEEEQKEAEEIGRSMADWAVSPPQFVTYGSPLSHLM